LFRFWQARSVLEGRSWLERALASGGGTSAERGKGALRAGDLAFFQGDVERATRLLRDAIQLTESAGDDAYHATALGYAGFVMAEQGHTRDALALASRCQELASGLADPWARAEALEPVAAILAITGNTQQANELWQDLLTVKRAFGDELRVLALLCNAGYVAMIRTSYDDARTLLEESLEIARRLRDVTGTTFALGNLGLVAVLEHRFNDAIVLLSEDLQLCASRGDRSRGAEAILGLAAAHAALGNAELAIKLDLIRQAVYDMARSRSWDPDLVDRLTEHLHAAWEETDPAIADALARQVRTATMDTAIAELDRHVGSGYSQRTRPA
jgi:tetratricopeptide (TPR) repeat protein